MDPKKIAMITGLCMALIFVMTAVFAGCTTTTEVREIKVEGSTTVLPLATAAANAYMDDNPDDSIVLAGGGSGAGIKAVGDGRADIGMASRGIKDSETASYPNLVDNVIAGDGIAVIVNTGTSVTGLTMEELADIYDGTITNWQDVGGDDATIVVVGRDSASGTRGTFDELVLDEEDPTHSMLEKNANADVQKTIKETPHSIGYVGLAFMDEVKVLEIGGVAASESTVKDGTYPISRVLHMYTDGEPTGLVKEYIDFILSAEGQQIVKDKGFVPV